MRCLELRRRQSSDKSQLFWVPAKFRHREPAIFRQIFFGQSNFRQEPYIKQRKKKKTSFSFSHDIEKRVCQDTLLVLLVFLSTQFLLFRFRNKRNLEIHVDSYNKIKRSRVSRSILENDNDQIHYRNNNVKNKNNVLFCCFAPLKV